MERRVMVWCIAAPLVLVVAGCVTTKKLPLQMDARFANVSTITLLPAVDARRDREHAVDLEADLRRPVSEALRQKGYNVAMPANISDNHAVSVEEIAEMAPAQLAKLGPADAQTLMIVKLHDVFSRYVVMAYTVKAEVEGIVIDKATGAILWRDKGVVSGGQVGLDSGVLAAIANPVRGAARSMAMSVPDRS
jgi:hypothetical protein